MKASHNDWVRHAKCTWSGCWTHPAMNKQKDKHCHGITFNEDKDKDKVTERPNLSCAIFLKMIWLKDYKYDGGGWITDASLKSIHKSWCTRGDTPEEMHQKICTTGDVTEVMQHRWCNSGDAREVMHQSICTRDDAQAFLVWWCLFESGVCVVGFGGVWYLYNSVW